MYYNFEIFGVNIFGKRENIEYVEMKSNNPIFIQDFISLFVEFVLQNIGPTSNGVPLIYVRFSIYCFIL